MSYVQWMTPTSNGLKNNNEESFVLDSDNNHSRDDSSAQEAGRLVGHSLHHLSGRCHTYHGVDDNNQQK
jgi:hypothetical protein